MKANDIKKKGILLKITVGAVAAIVIVIAALLGISSMSDKGVASVIAVYDEARNETTIYKNQKVIGTVEGMTISSRNMSDSVYYITNDNSTVYFINGKKIKTVGENLSVITIANNAKDALLVNEAGILYRYNGKKLEVITDKKVQHATISGDGKTYAYYTNGNSYFGTKPGKETKVEDVIVSYISDDAEYIYGVSTKLAEYLDLYDTFYMSEAVYSKDFFELYLVNKNGKAEVICEDTDSINGLNADGSEIIYTAEDGSYITVNGKDTYKLSDKYIGYMTCADKRYGYGHFKMVDSFTESAWTISNYVDYHGCCFISDEFKAEEIDDDCEMILGVDAAFKKILYLTTEVELRLADIKKDGEVKKLASDVVDGRISDDGEHIYYVNFADEMELHYVDKELKDSKIETFGYYGGVYVVGTGCYLTTEELFYVEGHNKKEVELRGNFFVDEATATAYNMDENNIFVLDGANEKKLNGEYEKLVFSEFVQ